MDKNSKCASARGYEDTARRGGRSIVSPFLHGKVNSLSVKLLPISSVHCCRQRCICLDHRGQPSH